MSNRTLTIRATTASDRDALSNLITLGSRRYVPRGNGLIAELDGTAVAAISLTSGAVAADPDRVQPRTVHALRRWRYEILRQSGNVGRALNVLRRLTPALA
jgi:hypothetical protein